MKALKRTIIAMIGILVMAVGVFAFTACPNPLSQYTIIVENGTGGGTFNKGQLVTITATIAEGYEFVGWFEGDTEVGQDNPLSFLASGDRTIKAKKKAVVSLEEYKQKSILALQTLVDDLDEEKFGATAWGRINSYLESGKSDIEKATDKESVDLALAAAKQKIEAVPKAIDSPPLIPFKALNLPYARINQSQIVRSVYQLPALAFNAHDQGQTLSPWDRFDDEFFATKALILIHKPVSNQGIPYSIESVLFADDTVILMIEVQSGQGIIVTYPAESVIWLAAEVYKSDISETAIIESRMGNRQANALFYIFRQIIGNENKTYDEFFGWSIAQVLLMPNSEFNAWREILGNEDKDFDDYLWHLVLDSYKTAAAATLELYAESKGENNYTPEKWALIQNYVLTGKAGIGATTTRARVDLALAAAKATIRAVPRESNVGISTELEARIKQTILEYWQSQGRQGLTINDVWFLEFGYYDGTVAIKIGFGDKNNWAVSTVPFREIVAGVDFHYPVSWHIIAWDNDSLFTLTQAYENGLLTRADLLQIHAIALTRGHVLPSDEEEKEEDKLQPLSAAQQLQIKQDFLSSPLGQDFLTVDDVIIHGYYGTYNNQVILSLGDMMSAIIDVFGGTETVAGITFMYRQPGYRIVVWYEGNFYSLTERHRQGLLTRGNIKTIWNLSQK